MKLIFTICLALVLTSCVKESLLECPYQYKIRVFVKDKNYNNSSAIGIDTIDENLPFKQYVSNIYYTLQNINTGENVINPFEKNITGDEKEIDIILDQIPDGEYRLTIWGNIEAIGNTVEDPSILHENKEEDTDEYIATEIIAIKTGLVQTKSIGLERIKGKLVVTLNNLPDYITQIREDVTSIYQTIDNNRKYSQETDVEKTFLKSTLSLKQISTFLAPTTDRNISILSLSFYRSDNSEPIVIVTPIEINITKNEITAVTINYNSSQNQLEVWVYIDNEWTLIQLLDINE
ncbi:hypothetical protein JGH11_18870 [Dysgonomonas sp. Marseille-P4677]|uniref:hypothetical protein n=1 Tax=Dysgonomonas sp. Marseille-P4677 TaxID=2364790 RepID=UPI001911CB05|nr:hypothetical protein [Dysgonomonas sp. Marseille-P4677]MBK5722936.1 hypothetical protein [Dysgonomonas sp. Marseille-P4677]